MNNPTIDGTCGVSIEISLSFNGFLKYPFVKFVSQPRASLNLLRARSLANA